MVVVHNLTHHTQNTMSDLPYDIDFVFAAHGNDDHALVNYKALQKEETSTDSFDSFESILSLSEITVASMQSSLPSSPEGDDSTTNSQPNREQASDDLGIVEFDMFDSGINEYEGVLDVQISRKRAADQLEGVDMLMCTETLEGEDGEAIKAKTSELVQASMKLGEAIYKAQGAEGAAPETAEKDDVIDAEFKEVGPDDHKKSA